MVKYRMELDRKQLQSLFQATEVFTRVCTSQFMIAIEEAWGERYYSLPDETRTTIHNMTKALSLLLTEGELDGSSSSFGISSPEINRRAHTSYNIHQVLRNQLFKERQENGGEYETNDSTVVITNGEEPITIERIDS